MIEGTEQHQRIKQPKKGKGKVPGFDPLLLFETEVGDWMDNSEVALQAGDGVKEQLSRLADVKNHVSYPNETLLVGVNAAANTCTSRYIQQLNQKHVVGEVVTVADDRGAEDLLETQVEDIDVEGKEEDDGGDGVDGDNVAPRCGPEAIGSGLTKSIMYMRVGYIFHGIDRGHRS